MGLGCNASERQRCQLCVPVGGGIYNVRISRSILRFCVAIPACRTRAP